MPEKKSFTKNPPEAALTYNGATKATYFVVKNRDFSANDVKQFELLHCNQNK